MSSGGLLLKAGGLLVQARAARHTRHTHTTHHNPQVKTLAKPVGRQLKADAEHVLWLQDLCTSMGQTSNSAWKSKFRGRSDSRQLGPF